MGLLNTLQFTTTTTPRPEEEEEEIAPIEAEEFIGAEAVAGLPDVTQFDTISAPAAPPSTTPRTTTTSTHPVRTLNYMNMR